jgi:hypothetical protein
MGAGGALVARQTYHANGGVRTSEGDSPTNFTFTGQRFDASSSLMYYGARYYVTIRCWDGSRRQIKLRRMLGILRR